MGRFGEKVREARLRWFGHVLRKDAGCVGRRMLMMELPGKRRRGRPERKFMDAIRGHDSSGCDGGRRRGENRKETENRLWRPLTGAAEIS